MDNMDTDSESRGATLAPRHSGLRKVAVGVLAAVSALALSACGQLAETNPRLTTVAAAGPQPSETGTGTPAPEVTPPTAPPDGPPPCGTGPYQLEIEQALAKIGNYGPITVDGVQ